MQFVSRLQSGERMSDLCREYGISRKTGYKYKARFEQDGPQALYDVSRRPHGHPRKTPNAVVQQVLAARKEFPTWGPKKLSVLLKERYPAVPMPCPSTIGVILVNEKGLGNDETKWAWGRLHGLQLISDFAEYPGGSQYNNPPSPPFFANAGGNHTVALAYPELDFLQGVGVSFRLACEMAPDGPSCNVQLAGGQSAHVDSPHCEDLLRKLLVNEPIDLVFDIDRAKAEAVRTVTFE